MTEISKAVLGIDLGTTFCSVAISKGVEGEYLIPNGDGKRATPSALHFFEPGSCVAGEEAVRMATLDPSNTIRFFKRHMGDPDFRVEFFGQTYRPQELTGLLVKRLVQDAEEALGVSVGAAVIAVPASFNSAQRSATVEAAELAGIEVLAIVNEPTAAALAHHANLELGSGQTLLVFDLGGGTLDATVMATNDQEHRILATSGDPLLGGKDFDEALLDFVADSVVEAGSPDPRDEPHAYQDLYERCVAAKIVLSAQTEARISVRLQGTSQTVRISREQLEALCQPLLSRCIETCKQVLERADVSPGDIDEILLVGGASRMPMVRASLSQHIESPIRAVDRPEELVAAGAAQFAKLIGEELLPPSGELQPVQRRVVDVTAHDLGLVVLDSQLQERILTLIPAATAVPAEKRGRFATAFDNMTAVQAEITEGTGTEREHIAVIGLLVLSTLPSRPKGAPIDVVYRYNKNQILEVDLVDVETGQCMAMQVELTGALDASEQVRARNTVAQTTVS